MSSSVAFTNFVESYDLATKQGILEDVNTRMTKRSGQLHRCLEDGSIQGLDSSDSLLLTNDHALVLTTCAGGGYNPLSQQESTLPQTFKNQFAALKTFNNDLSKAGGLVSQCQDELSQVPGPPETIELGARIVNYLDGARSHVRGLSHLSKENFEAQGGTLALCGTTNTSRVIDSLRLFNSAIGSTVDSTLDRLDKLIVRPKDKKKWDPLMSEVRDHLTDIKTTSIPLNSSLDTSLAALTRALDSDSHLTADELLKGRVKVMIDIEGYSSRVPVGEWPAVYRQVYDHLSNSHPAKSAQNSLLLQGEVKPDGTCFGILNVNVKLKRTEMDGETSLEIKRRDVFTTSGVKTANQVATTAGSRLAYEINLTGNKDLPARVESILNPLVSFQVEVDDIHAVLEKAKGLAQGGSATHQTLWKRRLQDRPQMLSALKSTWDLSKISLRNQLDKAQNQITQLRVTVGEGQYKTWCDAVSHSISAHRTMLDRQVLKIENKMQQGSLETYSKEMHDLIRSGISHSQRAQSIRNTLVGSELENVVTLQEFTDVVKNLRLKALNLEQVKQNDDEGSDKDELQEDGKLENASGQKEVEDKLSDSEVENETTEHSSQLEFSPSAPTGKKPWRWDPEYMTGLEGATDKDLRTMRAARLRQVRFFILNENGQKEFGPETRLPEWN